jgi:uncharacterized protein (DUF885 family)
MKLRAFLIASVLLVIAFMLMPGRTSIRSALEPPPASAASAELARFVDDWLDLFARHHPSIAAGNGLHQYDGRLDEFSAAAIQGEIDTLKLARERLRGVDPARLTPDEWADRRILEGLIDAWLLEQETLRNWQRNPMLYASAISDGVHNLMTMDATPAPSRARQVIAKLGHVPALLDAARTNIANPPPVFAARGLAMMRGVSAMLAGDLALAFASLSDSSLERALAAAADTARRAIDAYTDYLALMQRAASGDFAIGAENLRRRYRAEEMIDVPLDSLLALGMRQLAVEQEEFTAAARRVDRGRDALAVWRDVLRDHPRRGQLVLATQRTVDSLTAFVKARQLVELPANERVVVAASLPFDLGLGSMHASPPLEPVPVKSFYYITDASAGWPADRQEAWLQKFNYPSLTIVSAHEAMPGHFVHSLFMRRTPGKIRRIWIGLNPFPQPSSGQDGWAHYAERLVIDEGFKANDPRYRMAQLSESLTRICRLIAGIKLHTRQWTVDEAAKMFEEQAHLPAPAARQEAERGTYDPTYGGYFLGKRAVFALREDYAKKLGASFDKRAFHERVMTNGIAPWLVHRQLMLPGDTLVVVR